MKTFEDWIHLIESGEIQGNGFLTASLEHRSALRAAFAAGVQSVPAHGSGNELSETQVAARAVNEAEKDAIFGPKIKNCQFDGSQRFSCAVHRHDSVDIDPDDCTAVWE